MDKLSIVIPTLQKNTDVLSKLIEELCNDDIVGEIILIDNSLKGFEYNSDKLKIITPKKNLFVNPSWNLGIELAQYNYIAILNDDILLPLNLCKQILGKLKADDNAGLIGLDSSSLQGTLPEEMNTYPEEAEINFVPLNDTYQTGYWGAAIFGRKDNFCKIPEKLKIWCGDNCLLTNTINHGKQNYQISGCKIKHLGSTSINMRNKRTLKIVRNDMCYYAKYDSSFKKHPLYLSFWDKVFSIKDFYSANHKELHILGFTMNFRYSKTDIPFIKRILSVRDDENHKIFTFFGFKFKFKK